MRDFNFFEPYLQVVKKKNKGTKKKSPLISILKVMVMIGIIVMPLYIFGHIYMDNRAIDEMNETLNSPEIQEALKRVDEKRAYVTELSQFQRDLIKIHKHLADSDIILKDQINAIGYALPENVNIIAISLSNEECKIEGSAFTRDAIAEYQFNLRKTDKFENILLKNIDGASNEFYFEIDFQLKKVVE